VEDGAVMAEMDRPKVPRRRRAVVARLAASAMESGGALLLRAGEGEGK